MHVETFAVGPLGCNCSIVADLEKKSAIVIDPGGDYEVIQKRLTKRNLTVTAIVHTHTHFDHLGSTAELQQSTRAAAHIHEADRFLFDLVPIQAAMFGFAVPGKAEVEGSLVDGFALSAGDVELAVLHTPGHSPGSVCFVGSFSGRTIVFSGDTLFRRGIGRSDLWGGDGRTLFRSIENKLMCLDDETLVVPGHGDSTTIGEERGGNPFLR